MKKFNFEIVYFYFSFLVFFVEVKMEKVEECFVKLFDEIFIKDDVEEEEIEMEMLEFFFGKLFS